LNAKVEILYNPVDVEAFNRAERSDEVRRQLGATPADWLVGTVGRIHPRKDIATFLRAGAAAAKSLPRLRLVVVGPAEASEELAYRDDLLRLVDALCIGDRVCWTGTRSDMPRIFKALDVFVLCSRHEGFGRVVAEAIAAGTPAVVTREGALPELVEEERDALFASPGQWDDFARKIGRLCADPALRSRISDRAFVRAQAFSSLGAAATVAAAYERLRSTRPM
jgi:glycosyltransferase involved in cell wall biosynthesis